jgi:hypothetical protein
VHTTTERNEILSNKLIPLACFFPQQLIVIGVAVWLIVTLAGSAALNSHDRGGFSDAAAVPNLKICLASGIHHVGDCGDLR